MMIEQCVSLPTTFLGDMKGRCSTCLQKNLGSLPHKAVSLDTSDFDILAHGSTRLIRPALCCHGCMN